MKIKDIILKKFFNDFEIIEYQKDKKVFLCKCIHCGYERTYSKQTVDVSLKDEKSMRCGCTRSGVKIGDHYGNLTALQRDLSKAGQGQVYWLWRCNCGNITSLPLKVVKSGNTSSCGCGEYQNQLRNCQKGYIKGISEDLSGKKFGKLTVLRQATQEDFLYERPKGPRYWFCECECGNYHIASTSDLKRGNVQSCGCLLSKGEEKIANILAENSITFARQYCFNDFFSKEGRKYRFDFAVFKDNRLSYLIEYDGIQHFEKNKQFSNNEENFKKNQERDYKKNIYCIKKQIPLIRIPYTIFDNISINDLLLETTDFLVKE